MPLSFLAILLFVFVLAALIMALGTRPGAFLPGELAAWEKDMRKPVDPDDMEDLAEMISRDSGLLKPPPPVNVPHANLPGARVGGGAVNESCSKSSTTISIALHEDETERRKYNRRLGDRRAADQLVDEDKRLIQRRVWLRREEDHKGKILLNVTDAAATLGVTIEQLYKWLDKSDIPFYQVTEGKRKAIRFEVNELLQWHSRYARRTTEAGPKT